MARYSCDPLLYPHTRLHPLGNVAIFDGRRREIRDCREIDTETGWATCLVRDARGNEIRQVVQNPLGVPDSVRTLVERRRYDLPITFRKVNDDGTLGDAVHG